MRELSIFVDESGDFGPFEKHAPFYLFSLVFHDQAFAITSQVQRLEEKLVDIGMEANHCIHTGPIIRREESYQYLDIKTRRRLLNAAMTFSKSSNIRYTSFIVEKRQFADKMELTIALSRLLSRFIQNNLSFFQSFDRVVVYYDNGQVELNRILASVFSTLLSDVEFKKVIPAQYRLFQVADMCCTLELIKAKADLGMMSVSEIQFFGSMRDMKKNYLRPLDTLRF